MPKKVWRKGTLLHSWRESKLIQTLWGTVWRFLKKLGVNLPHGPEISLLCRHNEKTITGKDTCVPMFIAELLTISRTWKQPRYPLTDEWVKYGTYMQWNITQLYKIHAQAHTHTHTHTHTFESVLVRWMNLDPVTQSELSQKEKNKCHILTCIYWI